MYGVNDSVPGSPVKTKPPRKKMRVPKRVAMKAAAEAVTVLGGFGLEKPVNLTQLVHACACGKTLLLELQDPRPASIPPGIHWSAWCTSCHFRITLTISK